VIPHRGGGYRSGVEQERLFSPAPGARRDVVTRFLGEARTATRRASERNLTAVPTPSALRSPSTSQPRRTVGGVPRGGQRRDDVPPHGTRARYNSRRYPCRQPCCRAANRAYMARYRHGDESPTGDRVGVDGAVARTRAGPRR
jgi:hypothetical protein